MFGSRVILAAAAFSALTLGGLGAAVAAPFEHRGFIAVRDVQRPHVARARVLETLRLHRYVALGEPYFFHGRYVVRSHDRFGRLVLVEIDPFTGRFIGELRI